jgi:hypothetical protein
MSALPIPSNRNRYGYRLNRSTTATPPGLQGSAMPASTGGAVTNGTTYSEVVAVAGAAKGARAPQDRGTATGTLNIKPIAPVAATAGDETVMDKNGNIDPTKILAYPPAPPPLRCQPARRQSSISISTARASCSWSLSAR